MPSGSGRTPGTDRAIRPVAGQFRRQNLTGQVHHIRRSAEEEWPSAIEPDPQMDDMAASDLATSTMRLRQSAVSSFCGWLVKREMLATNPVSKLDRPPHHREPPFVRPGEPVRR